MLQNIRHLKFIWAISYGPYDMAHILKCLKSWRNVREGSKSRPDPKIYNHWARDGTERDIPGPPGLATLSFARLLFLSLNSYSLIRQCGEKISVRSFGRKTELFSKNVFGLKITPHLSNFFSEVIFTTWPWKMFPYKFSLLLFQIVYLPRK